MNLESEISNTYAFSMGKPPLLILFYTGNGRAARTFFETAGVVKREITGTDLNEYLKDFS